ncbi:MAG: acyl-CoA dehydrogenase family protein, partial [Anaerolineales bacterium]|nr:acyl-CoA dehydrogenase family protein [Anaerolineales bacterium]
ELALGLRDLPIMGGMLQGYGCAGLDALTAGLVRYELARGDGSIGTFYGVHAGLAMGSIGLLGSEAQKQRWLPKMATLDLIGAFALTEPERGSDAAHVLTTARRDGDDWVLNGRKRWIGNAPIADLIIVWARDEAGGMGGFVLEKPRQTPGVTITTMTGKLAKRAVLNADITLEDARVPAANRLADSRSFRDTARVLAFTRYSVAWEAAGLAAACLELALQYAKERQQFGRPIAGFQLIQAKLAEMAAAVTQMQLLCFRLAQLMAAGTLDESQVALAKYSNARQARRVAGLAREILGGNGLLIENHVARYFADAEAIYTYEGTNEINLLIVGRALTGIGAFS